MWSRVNQSAVVSTVACLVLLSGCARETKPEEGRQLLPPPNPIVQDSAAAKVLAERRDASANQGQEAEPLISEGTGEFINESAARRLPPADPDKEGEIVFNFEGQSLPEVVKVILGDVLNENYVIAPGVSGNVTFSTAKPIGADQVLPVLEMLLSWNNASLVWMDGRYHVLPTGRAIRGQLTPTIGSAAGQKGYEVRVFPLDYIAPAEMEKLLQPYAKEGAVISVDNARNLMILAGTPKELSNYQKTIDIFDVDWLAGMSVGMYPLSRVEADTVVTELEAVFGEGSGTPLAGMFRFMAIERLNSVMVITPQADYLKKAAEWVDRLDRGGSEAGSRLYVYDVKNVKATDLSDVLSDVFGGGGSSRRSSRNSGDVAPGLQAGEITSINDRRSSAQERNQPEAQSLNAASGSGSRIASDGGVALVDGEDIGITAVEESNSLLIRATPQQYDAVMAAVKRLDFIPLQVLVEVKVLEVTLNDALRFGVQWFFESAIAGLDFNADTGDDDDDGDGVTTPRPKGLFGDQPDKFGLLSGSGFDYRIRGADVGVIITALEDETDVRTISAPSLMVLNNREANINVGTQIPVNSPIFNQGTGNNIGQSRVQFRDTGVTLNVVPRVNPGGMVFMEVQQEVSTPLDSGDANGNVSVNQRRLDTEIAVQSGETVVLGGLIQATLNENDDGLPVLKNIPVLGGLFGRKSTSEIRTELLVLITPTVVGSVEEARAVSSEYANKMQGLKPFDLKKVKIDRDEK